MFIFSKNKYWHYFAVLGFFLLVLFLFPNGADAITVSEYDFDLTSKSPIDIAVSIINWFLGILALIALGVIIYGGILWMTSGGNPEKIDKAKKTLTRGLIGLLIILAAWAIVWYLMKKLSEMTGPGPGAGECIIDSECEEWHGSGWICCFGSCHNSTSCYLNAGTDMYVVSTWPRAESQNVPICTAVSARFSKDVAIETAIELNNVGDPNDDRYKFENYRVMLAGDIATGRDTGGFKMSGESCTSPLDCASGVCESSSCVGNHVDAVIKMGPSGADCAGICIAGTPREGKSCLTDGHCGVDNPAVTECNMGTPLHCDLGALNSKECTNSVECTITQYVDLIPLNDLEMNAQYRVYIRCGTDGIRAAYVNGLGTLMDPNTCIDPVEIPDSDMYFIWDFWTGEDTDITPPWVIESTSSPFPADEHEGEETYEACLNTPIGVDFTEAMLPSSFNDDFAVNLIEEPYPQGVGTTADYFLDPYHNKFCVGGDNNGLACESDNDCPPLEQPNIGCYENRINSHLLGLKKWTFGGLFDYFLTRPKYRLEEFSPYWVRLYGGSDSKSHLDAPLDMCGNPLDGNYSGDIDIEGTPKDDYISKDDTTKPNATPWKFTTGDNPICIPEIINIDFKDSPEIYTNAYYGVDYGDISPPTQVVGADASDDGGDGDAGFAYLTGKYFLPHPEVIFHSRAYAGADVETCFNVDSVDPEINSFTAGPPNTNPQVGEIIIGGETVYINVYHEGMCLLEISDTTPTNSLIDTKIPSRSFGNDSVRVEVAGEVSEPSVDTTDPLGQTFLSESPHIFWIDPRKGGVGQFITIAGEHFGIDEGRVWFIRRERAPYPPYTNYLPVQAEIPSNPDCGPSWTDTIIIAKVPEGFDKGDILYIQVETDNPAKHSNLVTFSRTDQVGPGLLCINPNCHSAGGGNSTYIGEKFGLTPTVVYGIFNAAGYDYTTYPNPDEAFIAMAPADLSNGNYLNRVIKEGMRSNALPYTLPCSGAPRVLYEKDCDGGEPQHPFPSPSPWRNTDVACIDTTINVIFEIPDPNIEVDMNQGYFSPNFYLYECNSGNESFRRSDCVEKTSYYNFTFNLQTEGTRVIGFRASHAINFTNNTWFEVVLDKEMRTKDNVKMDSEYRWKFTTQESNSLCPVEHVTVYPNAPINGIYHWPEIIFNTPADQELEAIPRGPQCQFLNGANYSWSWVSSNTYVAELYSSPYDSNIETTEVKGNEGVSEVTATEVSSGKSGDMDLAFDGTYCESDEDCDPPCPGSICDLSVNRCTPVIQAICPIDGPIGQWVTISGCMFGWAKGQAWLEYGSTKADMDWPDENICGRTWRPNEIIVQIPEKDNLGNNVTIGAGKYVKIASAYGLETTASDTFEVVTGVPGVMICLAEPNRRFEGHPFEIRGINFEDIQGPDSDATFYNGASPRIDGDVYEYWDNTKINTFVPPGAKSGDAWICGANGDAGILVEKGSEISNPLAFSVLCSDSSSCTALPPDPEGCCYNHRCMIYDFCAIPNPGAPCIKDCYDILDPDIQCQSGNVVCPTTVDPKDQGSPFCYSPYQCLNELPICSGGTPVCELTGGEARCTKDYTECRKGAKACYPSVEYSCLNGKWDSGNFSNCLCCCDPYKNYPDQNINSKGLICKQDVYPCINEDCNETQAAADQCYDRGMFCGCGGDDSLCNLTTTYFLGCGNDDCCRTRPFVTGHKPELGGNFHCSGTSDFCEKHSDCSGTNTCVADDVGDICPNSKLTISFEQVMDYGSLNYSDNIQIINLDQDCDEDDDCSPYSYCNMTESKCSPKGSLYKYNHRGDFGLYVTSFDFMLEDMLPMDEQIRFVVNKGVLSKWGLPMGLTGTGAYAHEFVGYDDDGDYIFEFRTREEICTVDLVYMDPVDYIFTDPDVYAGQDVSGTFEYQNFTAQAFSEDGQELVSYPSYGWDWVWWPENDDGEVVYMIDPNVVITPPPSPPIPDYVMYSHDRAENGDVDVKAIAANIGGGGVCSTDEDCLGDENKCLIPPLETEGACQGKSLRAYSDVSVFLCDNPWPVEVSGVIADYDYFPKSEWDRGISEWPNYPDDNDYNFRTMYCMDSGLPNLDRREKVHNPDFPGEEPDAKTMATYFITRKTDDSEVIGIRVFKNRELLTAAQWYQTYVDSAGSFKTTNIAGYDAIQVGNSTYIAASNVDSSGQIYSNIYLFSATEGTETVKIYNELLNNLKFATNVPENDELLQRDTRRITDIGNMIKDLQEYNDANGYYPDLTSGTYIIHYTNSIWTTSWSSFGNMLGNNYQDPINKMSFTDPNELEEPIHYLDQYVKNSCFAEAGLVADYGCLSTYSGSLPNHFDFERLEDVPDNRICSSPDTPDDQKVCCADGDTCLSEMVFDASLATMKCEADFGYLNINQVPYGRACDDGAGFGNKLCCNERQQCIIYDLDKNGSDEAVCIEATRSWRGECIDKNLLEATKTQTKNLRNETICCDPDSEQFVNSSCVKCKYKNGDVIYDDAAACWSTDTKRHFLPDDSYIYLYYPGIGTDLNAYIYANFEFPYDAEGFTWGGTFNTDYSGDTTNWADPCNSSVSGIETNNSSCDSFNYHRVLSP